MAMAGAGYYSTHRFGARRTYTSAALALTRFLCDFRRGADTDIGKHEVDLGCLQVDARNLDPDAVRQPIAPTAALAVHRVVHGIEMEVVVPEFGDVNQAIDVEPIQCDEQAEVRDAADRAVECFADAILHEIAF